MIIHAPVHNTPVFLTGRRSVMGYPGHIWTHGLEFVQRESEIKRIYLLHRFQGQGLGAQLMEEALADAKAAGFTRALLGVFGRNAAAIAFYRRQGFGQVGVRRFQVGANTYDDLVLARDL